MAYCNCICKYNIISCSIIHYTRHQQHPAVTQALLSRKPPHGSMLLNPSTAASFFTSSQKEMIRGLMMTNSSVMMLHHQKVVEHSAYPHYAVPSSCCLRSKSSHDLDSMTMAAVPLLSDVKRAMAPPPRRTGCSPLECQMGTMATLAQPISRSTRGRPFARWKRIPPPEELMRRLIPCALFLKDGPLFSPFAALLICRALALP